MDRRLHRFVVGALGTPWKLLGRGPESFDCWGFVISAFAAIDVEVPDAAYKTELEGRTSVRLEILKCNPSRIKEPSLGALVGMSNDRTGVPTHVGVSLGGSVVYHCLEGRGVIGTDITVLHRIFKEITFWRLYG